MKAKRQQRGAPAVGEEAKVSDADEAFGEQVQQESAQELLQRQGQQLLFIVVSGVAPTESDLAVHQRDQAMVGDRHAVRVAAQILEHIVRAPEGWFGVDHPVVSEQWPEPGGEGLRLGEQCQISVKAELAVLERSLETRDELAAKHATEHPDGKKEPVAWFHPVGVIERQSPGGHHAMHMRMKSEFLIPGVQHAEEADLRAEVPGIAGDFQKGFRTGAKQKIVDDLLILQSQWGERTRQGEDHMHVAGWQKLLSTGGDPPFPSSGLTLRAVLVSAGVVGDGPMPAAGALIEMPAQGGGATARKGQQHFEVLPAEPVAVSFEEGRSRSADEIGHLQGRPVHLFVPVWFVVQLQRVQRTGGGVEMALRKVEVNGGLFQIAMAQQDL